MIKRLWIRLRNVVFHRILGVDDTPHRIAWGVALGFFIAWTPTIGLQIVLYLFFAALLRANRISGIGPLFISNPVTAVPLYYFAWRVGRTVLHGRPEPTQLSRDSPVGLLSEVADGETAPGMLDLVFWQEQVERLLAMGADLWVGSFVMGAVNGIFGYVVTYWGVLWFRRSRFAERLVREQG